VQPRAQKTRASLLAAARREFSEHGYAMTTAKSIAERAAVGTGTFYHYFPDKDAVLREITAERVQSLLDEAVPLSAPPPATQQPTELLHDARQRLEKLVEIYVRYHRLERGLHAVLTERRLCDPELDGIMGASEREAVRRFAAALVRWGHDGDSEATAFMLFSLLEGAVHGHVLGQAMLPDERFSEGLVRAMLSIGLSFRD
jgi:AcrR family transcriptional regulator